MNWYQLTIKALRKKGITFEDNPFDRVIHLINRERITDWRDRADLLWCARQEWEAILLKRLEANYLTRKGEQ